MYTQCGQCKVVHRVSAKTLATAYGQVRCQRCGAVFNALDALADELREDGRFPLQFHDERPPVLDGNDGNDSSSEPLALSPAAVARSAAPAPSKPDTARRWWIGGGGVLLVTLLVQVVNAQAPSWRDDPSVRPLLERFCGWIGCQVPLRHDRTQLVLVNRDVRPHPVADSALLISATIENRAMFRQRYPTLGLRLFDLNNQPVASRYFAPSDYLNVNANIDRGLGVGTLLPIELEIIDPGKEAVAFEFSFH